MKSWEDFFDWVLPELPGVQNGLAEQYIRAAATEFLQRTGLYEVDIEPIVLQPSVPTYDVDLPKGYGMARVSELWFGDQPLLPAPTKTLARLYPNWQTVEGPPQHYFNEDTKTVRLVPTPDQAYEELVTGRAVLKPLRDATGVEDWIFEDWVTDIAAGAKAMLMLQQQKPWTNVQLGSDYRLQFRDACNKGVINANRSLTPGPLQVQMVRT